MRFGMFYELQLPRPWTDGDESTLFKNALEQGELCDRIGVDYAWAQEHHFLEEYSHSTAPEVFLAALSQRTKRMRIGHGVTLMIPNVNHPARVAERLGALDLVSGGRVEWGTGESSSRIELEGFRVNYLEKRAMWAEAVRETAKMMCSEPYAGFDGKYFSMPARNIVPKPVQRPHPPIWVACTNRDTMKLAARLGIGALTFSFMDAGEAKFWVEEYYDIFRRECTPIGRSVNPNIAMLTGLMCHRDSDTAMKRGAEGLSFFAYGLAHYYRFGTHLPGRTSIWDEFKKAPPFPMAGVGGIGNPDQIRENFAGLEQAGVDQLICLQQAAGYSHSHICESLELFGKEVLGGFKERQEAREAKKMAELAPYIEKALERMPPLEPMRDVPAVESYPKLWEKNGLLDTSSFTPKRSVGATALWKMHVGGVSKPKDAASPPAESSPAPKRVPPLHLVDLLRSRAVETPDKLAFTFLLDGEDLAVTATYAQIDEAARRVALRLAERAAPGDRAILLYAPGIDYITAFFGCLYAGVIAVPAYPPDPGRIKSTLPRLLAITEDSRASVILTTESIKQMGTALFAQVPSLGALPWIATDGAQESPSAWVKPALDPAGTAFLQYTSGSTGSPKGVILSHANLMANLEVSREGMRIHAGSIVMGWLPPYHDMGLIGLILGAIYNGAHGILMSPLDFLQQPFRWLKAISKYRVTHSGGPNFAYDLCVRRISASQRESLDLGSWEVAFNGAEPVRADTLAAFEKAFAPSGFRADSFYPCYGLAEATLMATGAKGRARPVVRSIDKLHLEGGRATPGRAGGETVSCVCSGVPHRDTRVVIVRPETGLPCENGEVGEIWLSGSGVASGYWNRSAETEHTFAARLAGGEGRFLRTGDLGFVEQDGLYVVGRSKDVIIVKGRKLHPQDLERSAERSHPSVRAGLCAAFGLASAEEERVVVAAEVDERQPVNADDVLGAIRQSIADEHQVQLYCVVLLKGRTLPKTSSGKIQRNACRAAYLGKELDIVAQWRATADALAT